MRKGPMRHLNSERGVAMVTVLLIGAALTVVSSTATFVTIQEFRANTDDRRAAEALSYAEAGIDRMLNYIRNGKVTYGDLNRAGCTGQVPFGTGPLTIGPTSIGVGSFKTELTVYDPVASPVTNRYPPAACANRPTSPNRPGEGGASDYTYFILTSTGKHFACPTCPVATRVVRQVVALEPIDLPVGLYGYAFDNKAHPKFRTISMFSRTVINDRGKDAFVGTDNYYYYDEIFPDGVEGLTAEQERTQLVPSAAHAAQGIFLQKSFDPEFPGPVAPRTRHCSANSTLGVPESNAAQSLWDSDGSAGSGTITAGCTGWPAGVGVYPNTSKFTTEMVDRFAQPVLTPDDHQVMKEAAISGGVYCSHPGFLGSGGTTCYKQGTLMPAADYNAYVQQVVTGGQRNLIAYHEFRNGTPTQNAINWSGSVWPCSDDPAVNKSVVLIVRNGGVNDIGAGGDQINGVLYMDGNFNSTGKISINGSLIAHGTVSFGSSSQTATLDSCWVKNMPGPLFRVIPGQWSEVDR